MRPAEVTRFESRPRLRVVDRTPASLPQSSLPNGLTVREIQVLRVVASGATNRQIADGLKLAVKTVDRHLSNIFAKVGVETRTAATAYAFKNGLMFGPYSSSAEGLGRTQAHRLRDLIARALELQFIGDSIAARERIRMRPPKVRLLGLRPD